MQDPRKILNDLHRSEKFLRTGRGLPMVDPVAMCRAAADYIESVSKEHEEIVERLRESANWLESPDLENFPPYMPSLVCLDAAAVIEKSLMN